MSKVTFKTAALKKSLESFDKTLPFVLTDSTTTPVHFSEDTKEVLAFLQDNMKLTTSQKSKISGFLYASDKLGSVTVNTVNDLFNRISFINESTTPVLEVKINNKWYPILASFSKFKTYNGSWVIEFSVHGNLGYLTYSKMFYFGNWSFEDASGKAVAKSIDDLFKVHGVRIASKESIEHSRLLGEKLLQYNFNVGKVYDASGTGLYFDDTWRAWHDINIGWKDAPATVVIEPTLENRYANHDIHTETWQLPFVRVFSFKHKNYMFVDIEDLEEHVYHKDGKDKIVLPTKIKAALEGVFNSKQGHVFGDLFHGRHGGIVVLANGPSGVGKTLTAEVFAEHQEKPLYVMEMSEIGTSLQVVEANLKKIFARAKKWGAVLLFDEADIFLSERVASDLERSAIVGIFLRLLDYYEGTFFLTTNRGEGIDTAFKSRVTLYLDYPELTPSTRKIIWDNMLQSAGIKIVGENSPTDWTKIITAELNGRQIRNQVRLLKLMHPNNEIYLYNIIDGLAFAAK